MNVCVPQSLLQRTRHSFKWVPTRTNAHPFEQWKVNIYFRFCACHRNKIVCTNHELEIKWIWLWNYNVNIVFVRIFGGDCNRRTHIKNAICCSSHCPPARCSEFSHWLRHVSANWRHKQHHRHYHVSHYLFIYLYYGWHSAASERASGAHIRAAIVCLTRLMLAEWTIFLCSFGWVFECISNK